MPKYQFLIWETKFLKSPFFNISNKHVHIILPYNASLTIYFYVFICLSIVKGALRLTPGGKQRDKHSVHQKYNSHVYLINCE